jgi:hypothetical protein
VDFQVSRGTTFRAIANGSIARVIGVVSRGREGLIHLSSGGEWLSIEADVRFVCVKQPQITFPDFQSEIAGSLSCSAPLPIGELLSIIREVNMSGATTLTIIPEGGGLRFWSDADSLSYEGRCGPVSAEATGSTATLNPRFLLDALAGLNRIGVDWVIYHHPADPRAPVKITAQDGNDSRPVQYTAAIMQIETSGRIAG